MISNMFRARIVRSVFVLIIIFFFNIWRTWYVRKKYDFRFESPTVFPKFSRNENFTFSLSFSCVRSSFLGWYLFRLLFPFRECFIVFLLLLLSLIYRTIVRIVAAASTHAHAFKSHFYIFHSLNFPVVQSDRFCCGSRPVGVFKGEWWIWTRACTALFFVCLLLYSNNVIFFFLWFSISINI
jgi:hypothetical protein